MGTLCVIDNKQNKLNNKQLRALSVLKNQVIKLFELRKKTLELELKVHELEVQNSGLEKFARVAAHDIKSPLANITMLSNIIQETYLEQMSEEGKEFFELIRSSSQKLTQLIDGILKYSRNVVLLSSTKEQVNINQLIKDLIPMLACCPEVKITIDSPSEIEVFTNKIAAEQILINLITNSIKYNDKALTQIDIKLSETEEYLTVTIRDNGPRIKNEHLDRIFQIFETASNADRYGEKGQGDWTCYSKIVG